MKPSIGRVVIVRTANHYNGTNEAPAMITRVHGDGPAGGPDCINATVLPDCHSPFSASSVALFETREDAEASGIAVVAWWPPRVP